jgi:hypothetical protein
MLVYQAQDCGMSFGDGIAEYYRLHPLLKRGDSLAQEAQAFFRCHDAVHVVYGCDTSLTHEAVVKLSSIFGTTAGFGVMAGYRLYESLDIYRQLRIGDILATIAASPVVVPRTIWRCRAQTKKWPWDAFEPFLGLPLADVRRAFGIRVAKA